LWHNGGVFHRWTAFAMFSMAALTIATSIVPWLRISYQTGNHLERVRQVFNFFDGNSNNRLEFEELSTAIKDKNFIFFNAYIRNDIEMMRSLLADQNSPCIQEEMLKLQADCAVGDRAACLQPRNWELERGVFMKNPQKIQSCITGLMQQSYVDATGDDCVQRTVRTWLTTGDGTSGEECLGRTALDINEFAMYARFLNPGLPAGEARFANHCNNMTVDMYMSVYGAMTIFFSLTNAPDVGRPRCHSYTGRVEPGNFSCSVVVDFWNQAAFDLPQSLDPLQQPERCRDMAGWLIDVFDGQRIEFGCDIQCTPDGRSVLSAGCVKGDAANLRENRYVNSPFNPTCRTRVGFGTAGDPCASGELCPSCSYPVNQSGIVKDVSPNKQAHMGTSGFSANFDTLCALMQIKFVEELVASVRRERANRVVAEGEKEALEGVLVAQCVQKKTDGDFAGGVIELQASTEGMTKWPSTPNNVFHCRCSVNDECPVCVGACADVGFSWPEADPSYDSTFDCTDIPQTVTSTHGLAAYDVRQKDPWVCDIGSPLCPEAVGALQRDYPFVNTVRNYAAPQSMLALMEVFGALCTVTMGIIALFACAFVMQSYNIWLIWTNVRASDDLSVEDAWQQEVFILRCCMLTFVIALVPAILYGCFIAIIGQFDNWGATHDLHVGWYIAILLAAVSLIPFYGAWKSFASRPAEWRNAMARFHAADPDGKKWWKPRFPGFGKLCKRLWRKILSPFRRKQKQKALKTASVVPGPGTPERIDIEQGERDLKSLPEIQRMTKHMNEMTKYSSR